MEEMDENQRHEENMECAKWWEVLWRKIKYRREVRSGHQFFDRKSETMEQQVCVLMGMVWTSGFWKNSSGEGGENGWTVVLDYTREKVPRAQEHN